MKEAQKAINLVSKQAKYLRPYMHKRYILLCIYIYINIYIYIDILIYIIYIYYIYILNILLYIPDHSICDIECVTLKGDFSNNTDRLIKEQTLIRKLKTHGLSHDLEFLTPYTYFHKWYTSPSTHTPLTFDLHLRTVATLTALNNVPLLTGLSQVTHLSLHPHSLDIWLTYGNSGHSYFTLQRSFVDFSWRRTSDEDRRCGLKFWTLYIFYWIKVFLKLLFAASFSVLYIYYIVICKYWSCLFNIISFSKISAK